MRVCVHRSIGCKRRNLYEQEIVKNEHIVILVVIAALTFLLCSLLPGEFSGDLDTQPAEPRRQDSHSGAARIPNRTKIETTANSSREIRLIAIDSVFDTRIESFEIKSKLPITAFETLRITPSDHKILRSSIDNGDFASTTIVKIGESPCTVESVELEDQIGKPLKLNVRVAASAKLVVSLDRVGDDNTDVEWSCGVKSCPEIDSGESAQRSKLLHMARRVPKGFRRMHTKPEHRFESEQVHGNLAGSPEFQIGKPGKYYVLATFNKTLRGTGALVEVELGRTLHVRLKCSRFPVVSGVLLDTQGNPVPNQKLAVIGEGPIEGEGLLVPDRRESFGVRMNPLLNEPLFNTARYCRTNENGEFRTPISLTNYVKIEAYIKGKGKLARSFDVGGNSNSIEGLVLRLENETESSGLVRIESEGVVSLKAEKIKLIRMDQEAGQYSPVVEVDDDGWLDTRWLEVGTRYRGVFRSHKFEDFEFVCRPGERVVLRKKTMPR